MGSIFSSIDNESYNWIIDYIDISFKRDDDKIIDYRYDISYTPQQIDSYIG